MKYAGLPASTWGGQILDVIVSQSSPLIPYGDSNCDRLCAWRLFIFLAVSYLRRNLLVVSIYVCLFISQLRKKAREEEQN